MNSENPLSPENALNLLITGNLRFFENKPVHPNIDFIRRKNAVKGQSPYAVIVSCSDSRVPPEIIFDSGIGDLFIVRSAGSILDSAGMGSIIYAVTHLECPLVVILGHESCGAIRTALLDDNELIHEPGAIIKLVEIIRDNIPESLNKKNILENPIEQAVKENIFNISDMINEEPLIKNYVETGKIMIKSAFYSLSTGKVNFFNR